VAVLFGGATVVDGVDEQPDITRRVIDRITMMSIRFLLIIFFLPPNSCS